MRMMTMTREVAGPLEAAGAWFELVSGQPRGDSAIAMIEVRGEVEGALRAMGVRAVAVGGVALRDLAGIDRGVVARWSERCCTIMAHAGPEIVRSLMEHLERSGLRRAAGDEDVRERWSEAGTLIEARMLEALSRAGSTLAVGELLAQPAAWGNVAARVGASVDDTAALEMIAAEPEMLARSRVMRRLIEPPTIAALGPANIGKSSLVNALAGRAVALSADQAGTTRDHVGVMLDLGGLAVRWLDLPGMTRAEWEAARRGEGEASEEPRDEAEIEAAARVAAVRAAAGADLLVLCGDAAHPAFDVVDGAAGELGAQAVRVHLRTDLGVSDACMSDVRLSVRGARAREGAGTGSSGLSEFVELVRERLVPGALLAQGAAWRFW